MMKASINMVTSRHFLRRHSGRGEAAIRNPFSLLDLQQRRSGWIDSPLLRLALRAIRFANVRSGILPSQPACAGMTVFFLTALLVQYSAVAVASDEEEPVERNYVAAPPAPAFQNWKDADRKSAGCVSCHTRSDRKTMHANEAVVLGCTDCHGGDATASAPPGETYSADDGNKRGWSAGYFEAMEKAHVLPRYPDSWKPSANPEAQLHRLLNGGAGVRPLRQSRRLPRRARGLRRLPHADHRGRRTILMANAAMFWGAAAYNNGILPYKNYMLGEAYTQGRQAGGDGFADRAGRRTWRRAACCRRSIRCRPGRRRRRATCSACSSAAGATSARCSPKSACPTTGQIQRLEEPGRPDIKQSNRGSGTGLRVAIPVLNIHKTRLNDPFIWFMGTNDQPGDYRHSGCASCHVVYANDREPSHRPDLCRSTATIGHRRQAADPTIPTRTSRAIRCSTPSPAPIPTAQCMNCHMHQPNMFLNTIPRLHDVGLRVRRAASCGRRSRSIRPPSRRKILDRNPEEAATRGKWADLDFLRNVSTSIPS